jgi:hypothetical protein
MTRVRLEIGVTAMLSNVVTLKHELSMSQERSQLYQQSKPVLSLLVKRVADSSILIDISSNPDFAARRQGFQVIPGYV